MIWSVIVASIGHQTKSRNKMWVLNHLIWLASINDEDMSLLHSIRSAWPLWSLDQKDEPDGYDTVVNVEAYTLVYTEHLGCYLDKGTRWAFL
jgi:hypothetical protein